jgi:hypothetical protein
MADDKSKRGSPDSKRLNKSEPYEMAHARKKAKASAGRSTAGGARKAPAKKTGTASRGTSTRKAPATRAAAPRRSGPALKTRGAPNPPKGEKTGPNTAPRTMKERDAVDLLVDDHLEVDARFKRYDKLAEKDATAGERKALALEICAMLRAHTAIEEEIFYPAARKAGIDADMLDEADIEHASAKDLMAQIEAGDADDDKYDAKVKVLGEYINHHVVEEHTEMFPKCRRAGMDLPALRAEMEARKAQLLPPN